jgi:hypothetical protein
MTTKHCRKCGDALTVGDNWRPSVAERKHLRCNKCISINRREYYVKNQEHLNTVRKAYRSESPNVVMYTRIKAKAKKYGIPFNLELSDIVIPEVCPVFGVPFVYGRKDPYNISLDKIFPALGYTKGNVIVVSVRANTIKNDASVEELAKVLAFYKSLNW